MVLLTVIVPPVALVLLNDAWKLALFSWKTGLKIAVARPSLTFCGRSLRCQVMLLASTVSNALSAYSVPVNGVVSVIAGS